MPLEDKYLDVLQNIEFAIINVYREDPGTTDMDVIQALEALVDSFHRKPQDKERVPPNHLSERAVSIFNSVIAVLAFRKGIEETPAQRPRFSRAFRTLSPGEIYLACLRKIEKSARRWHKRKGERGYLEFVDNYLP